MTSPLPSQDLTRTTLNEKTCRVAFLDARQVLDGADSPVP
jgi:hypothetical protein